MDAKELLDAYTTCIRLETTMWLMLGLQMISIAWVLIKRPDTP